MSRIFQPRERVRRQQAEGGDNVGRFRSGYQHGKKPVSLSEWRVTSDDPEVADAVLALLGGDSVQEWDSKGDDNLEVFTKASEVDVILDGLDAIDARMIVWAKGQKKLVVCGDEIFETDGRTPYICEADDYTTRAEHDENGHVCDPLIKVRFRLKDNPDLGYFEYQTGAWSLASNIGYVMGDIVDAQEDADGDKDTAVYATLKLERAEFEKDGKPVKFTRPSVNIGAAVTEAA